MTKRSRSNSDANDIVKKKAGKKKEKAMLIDQTTNGYFFIRFEGGGEVPNKLAGKYLRYDEAQRAVDSYLKRK